MYRAQVLLGQYTHEGREEKIATGIPINATIRL